MLTAEEIWPGETKRPHSYDTLIIPVIDWLCTKGLRRQIAGWLGKPATGVEALANQLSTKRPRKAGSAAPTIAESARALVNVLLDAQSTSTLAVLRNIAKGVHSFGGKRSDFPGRLDEGFPVMGSWDDDGSERQSSTRAVR